MALPVLKIKKLTEKAQLPLKMTKGAAGLDLFVSENVTLFPRRVTKVRTGLAVSIPKGYHGELHIRSSWGKRGIRPANCTGIVDSDYRGEVIMYLNNDNSSDTFWLKEGTRVAQLILVKDPPFSIKEVETLDETERGEGGFGSTDEKEKK